MLFRSVFNQLRGMITGYYKVDAGEVDPGRIDTAKPDQMIVAEERSHD